MCTSHRFIYASGRVLIDRCTECMEEQAAEEKRRETQRVSQVRENERQRASEAAVHRQLPTMTQVDWVAFLQGDDPWDTFHGSSCYQGRRPSALTTAEAAAIFAAARFPTRRIELQLPFKPRQTFQKSRKFDGWIVGEGHGTTTRYDDQIPVSAFWAVLKSGELLAVNKVRGKVHFSKSPWVVHGWSTTPADMASARRWLKAPGPAKNEEWPPADRQH